jgi:hypothetical protein
MNQSAVDVQLELKAASDACVASKLQIESFVSQHLAPKAAHISTSIEAIENNVRELRETLSEQISQSESLFGTVQHSQGTLFHINFSHSQSLCQVRIFLVLNFIDARPRPELDFVLLSFFFFFSLFQVAWIGSPRCAP